MKKWFIRAKKADFDAIARKHNISPIMARLLRNRDVISDDDIDRFLNSTLSDMYDPFLLDGMDKACDILIDAINAKKHIRVIGDYDADGVCATYILVRGIREMFGNVSYMLPHRIMDGYGINKSIIDDAKRDGVELIITCDNGIAAIDEIAYAKELGLDVIITDHHDIVYEEINGVKEYILPEANCIVNPHMSDEYPYKEICGALVAYKYILALQRKTGKISLEVTDMLLDFAAFATITDVMPLIDENRTVVKYGLRSIKATKNIGLSVLIDETGVKRDRLSTYHVAFILGPCVNAVGRLYTAEYALELFLSEDYEEALRLAKVLTDANKERKKLEQEKIKESFNIIENGSDGHDYSMDAVLMLYLKDCHESLAGLIAGKLKEKYSKPTIVFTDSKNGLKGSGRSVDGYNIFDALSKYKYMYQKFGGHPKACGLTIDEENFEELRQKINKDSIIEQDGVIDKYYIDIDMPINYVTYSLLSELDRLAPFGEGNPAPLFAQKNLEICSLKTNSKGNMLLVELASPPHGDRQATRMYATMYGDAKELYNIFSSKKEITIAYVPEYNTYYNRIQLQIKDYL